jgi:AcrR family transcriptional regulator
MYHIKEDIRAERSALMLYEGLMSVLKDKKLSKVTVSDISKVSTVGRATFYRNFDEIIDILYWRCDTEFARVLRGFTESTPDLSEEDVLLKYVLSFWMKNRNMDLLEILIEYGRTDIIYNSFMNHADIVMKYVKKIGIKMPANEYEYFISVRAGFFVGIICAWMRNGKNDSPEKVAEIISRQHDEIISAKLII